MKCKTFLYTIETAASETIARISAQETTPGQDFSNAALILSTTSNPLVEFAFDIESFSVLMDVLLSNRSDPSQP